MEFNKIFNEYVKLTKPVKTLIHWYDLYEGHLIRLEKSFQRQLFEIAIKKAGNFSELERELNISRQIIAKCYKFQTSIKIKTLKKIVMYVNCPLKEINRQIIQICGLKPKFPFSLHNIEGAEIRAAFLSDGHVDKSPVGHAQYCAYERELHERLIILCKKVFGEFKAEIKEGHKTLVTRFPAAIGDTLELSGVPRGNKLYKKCYVPKDILLGNKKIQCVYLRRVFDDEGDVCFDKYGKRAIRITRSTNIDRKNLKLNIPSEKWTRYKLPSNLINNLILGEQLLLIKLGIDARLYPEGVYKSKNNEISAKWRIQIGQQDQVRQFAKLIGFNLVEKQEKLDKILNSYKYRKLPNGKGKEEALAFVKIVYSKKGYFTFGDLAQELVRTGRSYDLAGAYLKDMISKNIITKTKRGVYVLVNN